ncbi:hypothetical protein MFIFM68171_01020 [Madurella fahalii]|uniref:Uncharacterized protein n=1 Tax=Madurella fahalii TaxID=1157608 RepID=A0ABQ0FZ65_9PEZI
MDQQRPNYPWLPLAWAARGQGAGQGARQGTPSPAAQNDNEERGRDVARGRLIPLPIFPQGPAPDRPLPPIPQEQTPPPPPPGLSVAEREVILHWIHATAFPEDCEPAGALGEDEYFEEQGGQVWVEDRSVPSAPRDRGSTSLRDLFELIEIIEGRCLYPELEAPAEEEEDDEDEDEDEDEENEEDEEGGDFQDTWPARPPSETGLGLWLAANRKALAGKNHPFTN